MDTEDVDRGRDLSCLKGGSKSVQLVLNGTEAVLVLTLIVLKLRAL